MPSPVEPVPMLSYAARPRRRWRRYVLGLILLLFIGVGVYWRTLIANRITHLYWQHRVATFEYPEGVVVCEAFCWQPQSITNGWPGMEKLLRSPTFEDVLVGHRETSGAGAGQAVGLILPEITSYITAPENRFIWSQNRDAGVLFLSERKSQGGTARIITVVPHFFSDNSEADLYYRAIIPATILHQEQYVVGPQCFVPNISIQGHNGFRAFGGQRDPTDASRFTIDYETATEKGTIVGVLQDDGSVLFSILKR